MTDEGVTKTFVNDLDREDEANGTHLTNTCITETAGFQTAMDGEEEKSATNNNSTRTTETVGFQTQKDRVNVESASHPSNTGMTATVGFESIQDKVNEESASHPSNTGMTATEGLVTMKDKGIEELGAENLLLKTLLGDLHKTIIEGKGNPIKKSCIIKPDTPVYVQHRQIQEIHNNFKEMESEMERAGRRLFQIFSLVGDGLEHKVVATGRAKKVVEDQPDKQNENYQRTISALEKMKQTQQDIKRFEDENRCLEFLLSCLHEHICTGAEAKNISFELPSAIPHDSAVSSSYNAAQAIWNKFMKMKGSNEKIKIMNKKLLMFVEDMDRSVSRKKETVTKLRNRIKILESNLESKSTVNKQIQTGCEELQETIDIIMLREKETVAHLRNREQDLLSELKSIDAVNKQLHKDCQTLQRRIDELTDEKEQCKQNFQIQKDLNRALDVKWTLDRELLQKADASINMMKEQIAAHQQNEILFTAAYDAEVMKTENQTKQIDGLKLKSDELLNRSSKLAGDRLTHENTNITDLSDPNRPTKLAEAYSELYDNEWTDAFEELINRNLTEKAAVRTLCDLLLASFHKCREITWERYRSLMSIVSTIDIHVLACVRGFPERTKTTSIEFEPSSHNPNVTNATINLEGSNEEAHNPDTGSSNTAKESKIIYHRAEEVGLTPQSNEKLPIHTNAKTMQPLTCTNKLNLDQEKEIKRIWRTTTTALQDEAVKRLHSVLLTMFDVSIDEFPKTSKYLAICIDLCWKMGIQERPMHLDAVVETNDGSEKIFDLSKYRPYTKTGKRVAFVVWPALFLHEGGAMLVKGIAQGCKETDKCNDAMHT